jgi:hypothetical protein
VFTRDLTECVEEATGQTTFGPYELHDLVALDPSTVGLIVKVSAVPFRRYPNHLRAVRAARPGGAGPLHGGAHRQGECSALPPVP